MSHGHAHSAPESGFRLAIVVGMNFIITAVEIVGGLISGNLSQISDALHNFSDGIAVIIAWFAIHLDARPRTGICKVKDHSLRAFRAQMDI